MSAQKRKRTVERRKLVEARLGRESALWLATVGDGNVPHLVPIYYIWLDGRAYLCTTADSQEWIDLHSNQRVTLSLPDPYEVIVIEGEAHAIGRSQHQQIATYFLHKYDWDILGADYKVVEITPLQILAWGDKHEDLGLVIE